MPTILDSLIYFSDMKSSLLLCQKKTQAEYLSLVRLAYAVEGDSLSTGSEITGQECLLDPEGGK